MLQAKIRRGELDREVTFIKPVITRGDSNEDKVTGWDEVDTYPTVFARRKELAGNEVVINDQIHFMQKTEFIVVYRTDLTTKNRLVFNDGVYEIVSITEHEQRRMYTRIIANLLDNEESPLQGGFAPLAFSSGFDI